MRLKQSHILAISNQKGGCGKTTTAVNLAAGLALEGYSTSLVDVDSQCNATNSFGIDRARLEKDGRFTIADAYIQGKPASEIEMPLEGRLGGKLTLVPGHRGLGSTEKRLEAELQAQVANPEKSHLDQDDIRREHRHRLKNSLQSLRGKRDAVLIDTPPDLDFLMTSALIAADWFIIPVFPSGYDLAGLEALTKTVQKVQKRYNPRLRLLGVLLGNFHANTKLDGDIQARLAEHFGEDLLFKSAIHSTVKLREAPVYGFSIFEHAENHTASEQFRALAREVLARLEPVGQTVGERPVDKPEEVAAELKEAANG